MSDISVTVSALNIAVEVAQTGPQGPQGPAGEGVPSGGSVGQVLTKISATDYDTEWQNPGAASFLETYNAGENLSAGRVVIIDDNEAFYFQPADPAHAGRAFGITKSSATNGNAVTIQPFGVVTDAAFSSLTAGPVWATANGQISNTRPTSGNIQKAGVALGNNKILIDFSKQITTL